MEAFVLETKKGATHTFTGISGGALSDVQGMIPHNWIIRNGDSEMIVENPNKKPIKLTQGPDRRIKITLGEITTGPLQFNSFSLKSGKSLEEIMGGIIISVVQA